MRRTEPNRLISETSPYLLQHARNPVDWYPWGDDALAEARRRNSPVLLSVGYSACHWCHVMERESFSDDATAETMNRHFVCVKVDREERPDIDSVYMAAVQSMSGRGGWPMTVFLTPEGHPFHAGTYYPPEDRYGMPAFRRVLEAVARAWANRRSVIEGQARAISSDIARSLRRAPSPDLLTASVPARAAAILGRAFDSEHGGFGGAPKFPQPMALDFLLRHAGRTGSRDALEMATRTLDCMARGGIFDHVGGGFHRYATDAEWLVPHFEKMLYDNAQLATVYLRAWRITGSRRWLTVAERTLDYIRHDMTAPSGAFYSSEDADSDGEEGRFYTWTPEEVSEAVGAGRSEGVCRALGVIPSGHLGGRSVPHLDPTSEAEPVLDAAAVALLRRERGRRARPARDDKAIVAWNAMALSAFAEAAMLTGRADYLQTALNSGAFLVDEMTRRDGAGHWRVLHSGIEVRGEDAVHPSTISAAFRASGISGFLDDYALLADALVTLHSASGEPRWLEAGRSVAAAMLEQFAGHGDLLHMSAAHAETLFVRPVPTEDNSVPSGNAVAAEACLRLAGLPGPDSVRCASWAHGALRALASLLPEHPLAFGRWLCAAETALSGMTTVVVSGEPDDLRAEALADVARRAYRPNRIVARAQALGTNEYANVAGAPAAYVCRGDRCLEPLTSPESLGAILGD